MLELKFKCGVSHMVMWNKISTNKQQMLTTCMVKAIS